MRCCLVIGLVLWSAVSAFADWPTNIPKAIPLWSQGAPGSESRINEAEEITGDNVCNVHNPTLTPYVP